MKVLGSVTKLIKAVFSKQSSAPSLSTGESDIWVKDDTTDLNPKFSKNVSGSQVDQNIPTADQPVEFTASGPVSITIPTSGTLMTTSSSDIMTNKTFDADGTGNVLSNVRTDNLASGVLDTDLSSVAADDTTIPSAKASKTYIDTKIAGMGTVVDNRVPKTNGTTGLALEQSGVSIDDSNNMSGVVQMSSTSVSTGNVTASGFVGKAATSQINIPAGTNAERATGVTGDLRYNIDIDKIEVYDSAWKVVGGGLIPTRISASTTLEAGKLYVVDMELAGADFDLTLPTMAAEDQITCVIVNNADHSYRSIIKGGSQVIWYNHQSGTDLKVVDSETWISVVGVKNGGSVDIHAFDAKVPISGTLSGSLDITGTLKTDIVESHTSDGEIVIRNTNSGAAANPVLVLDRNSASAADGDVLGKVIFRGNDDAGTPADNDYASIEAVAVDSGAGSEDGKLIVKLSEAGSATDYIVAESTKGVKLKGATDGTATTDSSYDGKVGETVTGGGTAVAFSTAMTNGGISFNNGIQTTNYILFKSTGVGDFVGVTLGAGVWMVVANVVWKDDTGVSNMFVTLGAGGPNGHEVATTPASANQTLEAGNYTAFSLNNVFSLSSSTAITISAFFVGAVRSDSDVQVGMRAIRIA